MTNRKVTGVLRLPVDHDPFKFLDLALFSPVTMAVLFFRLRQCIVLLVACFVNGFVLASSTLQGSDALMFPLASFTMNLTSGKGAKLVFTEIETNLQNVVVAQLNAFLEASSGKVTTLTATLVATNPSSIVVLFTGEAAFSLGIAPDSVTSIEKAAIQEADGYQQLMQRIRHDPKLPTVESLNVNFLMVPSTTVSSSSSGGQSASVARWFIPVVTVISILLFIGLLIILCIILLRVRARRLRRQEKQDVGSKATRESDSETSEEEDESTWYEDITREIKEFNADAASWLDDWAKSIQSVQFREPSPQTKRKTSLTTPRPAARQSSRLTLASIDEESAISELPAKSGAAKKAFAPSQLFNPHDMPVPEDPNVPALTLEHAPSRAFL